VCVQRTMQRLACWRRHTFLILTFLTLEPNRLLAFFSSHLMSELTPPSASPEALLLFQPVTFSSTKPPLAPPVRSSLIATSRVPDACRRISRCACAPSIPPRLGLLAPSFRGPVGGPVPFPTPPRPFTGRPMVRSPSRSAFIAARRVAAGPRGAARGAVWRATMLAPVGGFIVQVSVCW